MSTLNLKRDTRHWWLLLVSGLILVMFGVWIFMVKLAAYLTISLFFAIGILGTGLMELLFVIFTQRASGVVRWALLGALADILIGGYLWFYPLISLIIVPAVLGFWLVLRGILAVISALHLCKRDLSHWKWLLFCGVLIIITGVILLANMLWGTEDIILHTGAGFIITGIFRIYLSFRFKNLF